MKSTRTGNRRVVFLYPGLGNQHPGMGAGLYRGEPVFREAVDRCARLLKPHLKLDLRDLLLADSVDPEAGNGALDLRRMLGRHAVEPGSAEASLQRTRYAQPAVFVVEYALTALLRSWGVQPDAMLGYSLGEYVAAHTAGVMALDDALRLVALRARLMDGLPAGMMLAVPLPAAELEAHLGAGVSVSAANGPALSVVAGSPRAISSLAAELAGRDTATYVVPTTHAFHTDAMRPVADDFRAAMAEVRLAAPAIPYVSTLTGDWVTAAQATSPDYWVEHGCQPVLFAAGMTTLRRAGYDLYLETGPGGALTSLVPGLDGPVPHVKSIATMRHHYDPRPDADVLRNALGALWLAGAEVDWARARAPQVRAPAAQEGVEAEPGPEDEIEGTLVALWCELLRVPAFERSRTFFELGGNSLLATQLLFRLRKALRVALPLRAVYEAPTVPALAARVRLTSAAGAPSVAAPADPRPEAAETCELPGGLTVLCPSRSELQHFVEDIFEHRTYLQHGVSLPPGAVVFDVGANVGVFSLFVHTERPDARVLAFEPVPPLFLLLETNLSRHGVRARVYPYALAAAPGRALVTYYPNSSGLSSLHPDAAEERAILETVITNQIRRGESEVAGLLAHADDYFGERLRAEVYGCRVATVSEILAETGLERIDLLKVDVQKAEAEVLAGVADDDWPRIRQVVAEVHDADGRLAGLTQLLEERGFRITTEQDPLYAGSNVCVLYAVRP